jgi:hypothetical protein
MPINVKPLSTVVNNYVTRAGAAGAAYTAGVQAPRQPWAAATSAAATTWANGVSAAVTDGRFAKGVNNAGDATWSSGCINVGAARYPGGIAAGKNKYSAKISPYLTAISNLTLPARLPKGDPGNVQRVAAIDAALRALKLSLG